MYLRKNWKRSEEDIAQTNLITPPSLHRLKWQGTVYLSEESPSHHVIPQHLLSHPFLHQMPQPQPNPYSLSRSSTTNNIIYYYFIKNLFNSVVFDFDVSLYISPLDIVVTVQ
eukprot:m.25987 g.25987  ORF g.25987 m.25987 type:complete len:112 (-) comp9225_c0_seq1:129-464(-)